MFLSQRHQTNSFNTNTKLGVQRNGYNEIPVANGLVIYQYTKR